MRTAEFDFELPAELIAQVPAARRDQSRLLVVRRDSGKVEHRGFEDLADYLRPGDVLVLNNSRVVPARVRGRNSLTDGQFEILLVEENTTNDWWVLLRPGRRARVGTRIGLHDPQGHATHVRAVVIETNAAGHRRLLFSGTPDILRELEQLGEVPLPPYISRPDASQRDLDRERYQTVYAGPPGSVAAPTAGLHFTEAMLERMRQAGVRVCFLTLHVGLGTFAPVKTETLSAHVMHEERYELPASAAQAIQEAKAGGARVFAVGTTTVRVLESNAAAHEGRLLPGAGRTRIFIYPPYPFQVVDALLTTFPLPRSTLLMLVSAFAAPGGTRGREMVLAAYAEAVRQRYRFFSYGDAMLIL